MKKFFYFLLLVLLVLIVVVLVRTFSATSKQVEVAQAPPVPVSDSAIVHLQKAIQFKTISTEAGTADTAAFNGFRAFLQQAFPLVHQHCQLEIISGQSMLFYWKGIDANIKPIILVGHYDVVPVEEESLPLWKADPFAGAIIGDSIYGRGAVDDKGSVMAILEAIEQLLRENYQPQGDVYLAFGHDEEATGQQGAKVLVPLLKQRGINPAFVLDEGGLVTAKEIPGVTKPVALVGIAEKGYVTVDLSINIPGGHSSMPAKETAIDQMSKALLRLKENPFPADLNHTINAFMDYMGPEMPFVQRMAFANRWLFSPLIKNIYSSRPGPDAMIRTTTAPTIVHSGVKENVIPTVANATVNFRTLPGTTVDDVVKHMKEVIDDDRVTIKARSNNSSPQAVADVNDHFFTYLQQCIRSWRNDVVVSPYLVLGATDGRYYTELTPNVFRFIPFNDVKGFHGTDERVGVDEYKKGIAFYYGLLRNWKGGSGR
ncbi:M20 family peptidase [Aridibaculum aurantiacum]|uniref:M20 family peptidase n=1 Tax=Aridibaculum aurantiacum TaxID=2810307 RepID=UPI001A96D8CF|nr:M20 family peptidase [Aridibaculum aurantiacum]